MVQPIVKRNKAVFFTYSITDKQGEVLEQVDLPMGYIHGADSGLIEKVEKAMEGCTVDDTISVELTPSEGFGELNPALSYTDDIENVPPEFQKVGAEVEMQNDRGEVKTFVVSKIEGGKLTVDGNHPLAGKDLVFRLKITEIRDASPDEINSGRPDNQNPIIH
jgi:FKBP-type peptidyl-prolyl cis-trans isomerase SlyD